VPQVNRLTDVSINALPVPKSGAQTYWEKPLGVRVTAKGVRSYIVILGSGERKTLGRVGVVPLKDARTAALRLKADHQPKKYKAPPVGLAEARTAYLKAITVRPKTRAYYEMHLARLPDMPLEDLEHRHVLRILDTLKPSSSILALRTFKAFFNWCVPRFLKYSPCTGLRLSHKIGERSRVLIDDELKSVWLACSGVPSGNFESIVKLLILTGMRRTECSLIQKSWINEKQKTLTIPASVTKNARIHTIPISQRILDVIAVPLKSSTMPFLFAAQHSPKPYTNWSKPKKQLDEASGVTDWVLHTLRHTYRSNLARLRCPPHIAERLVNHVSSRTALERIYDHHTHFDEMREWQEKYEDFFYE
jgi:integrase